MTNNKNQNQNKNTNQNRNNNEDPKKMREEFGTEFDLNQLQDPNKKDKTQKNDRKNRF
ncbi:hypothetical protein [Sporosarcina sp. G11-34]|uniref:hypothetical protein n=1 Tax=Sporosarcina sp. G11-34 TaxID=2849605 RepID=UPI0022A9585D|nr:hypothetical protein [Sporosarcina sp. G11-34]MCZ2258349.1 hypothetical protein [Sporosarcina sp. G11-34]